MFSSLLFFAMYLLKYGVFLVSYVAGQNKFPKPLSAGEERQCLERAAEGDKEAREKLVEHNLRLVAHIAKKYNQVAGCDEDDLVSIGTIGLMKAVYTFDYKKQARLATYAARCIENEILMTVRAGKKLKQEVSLNECLGHDTDGNEVTFMDILASGDEDIAERVGIDADIVKMQEFLERLEPREREIVIKRYGLGERLYTQQEIAKEFGISRSYVSRIEKKALKKLKNCFEESKKRSGGKGENTQK